MAEIILQCGQKPIKVTMENSMVRFNGSQIDVTWLLRKANTVLISTPLLEEGHPRPLFVRATQILKFHGNGDGLRKFTGMKCLPFNAKKPSAIIIKVKHATFVLEDFLEMIYFILTAETMAENDPRIVFIRYLRGMKNIKDENSPHRILWSEVPFEL